VGPSCWETSGCCIYGKRDTFPSDKRHSGDSNGSDAHIHCCICCRATSPGNCLDCNYDKGLWKTVIYLHHRTNDSHRGDGGRVVPPDIPRSLIIEREGLLAIPRNEINDMRYQDRSCWSDTSLPPLDSYPEIRFTYLQVSMPPIKRISLLLDGHAWTCSYRCLN